jgi:hypothetical protein
LGYIWLLPKLERLWLLIGDWPELVYEETDAAGVSAGVSMLDEVKPCTPETPPIDTPPMLLPLLL